ncbi:hypothetical protein KC360_g139 [Hortaea werneckii]|nr:hypothetical protein KC360_g139 [Hortaea werneckii]
MQYHESTFSQSVTQLVLILGFLGLLVVAILKRLALDGENGKGEGEAAVSGLTRPSPTFKTSPSPSRLPQTSIMTSRQSSQSSSCSSSTSGLISCTAMVDLMPSPTHPTQKISRVVRSSRTDRDDSLLHGAVASMQPMRYLLAAGAEMNLVLRFNDSKANTTPEEYPSDCITRPVIDTCNCAALRLHWRRNLQLNLYTEAWYTFK